MSKFVIDNQAFGSFGSYLDGTSAKTPIALRYWGFVLKIKCSKSSFTFLLACR